jgi:DNA-directed RNA polymerase II subunit RPB11
MADKTSITSYIVNKPEPEEAIYDLPENHSHLHLGKHQVHVSEVTKVTNTKLFQIWKEDHTVANLLREKLLDDDKVIFAGYRVPHPLENRYEVRVQAKVKFDRKDDSRTVLKSHLPETIMNDALQACHSDVETCLTKFDEALKTWREQEGMDVDRN